VDETGHTFRARVGTTWAPRGRPPVLRRVSRRREVSSLVLVTAPCDGQPARLFARHFEGTIDSARVIATLPYFRRKVGRPLLLVWDRLNAHVARRTQQFLARHAEDYAAVFLPGYAPELNPEEQCNRHVKHALLNALPPDVATPRADARREFQRLGRQPDTLAHFFAHAGLHVT
jgi:transposase